MTALGLTAPHPGQRCKPPWYQRALTRLRTHRQRRAVEDARDQAYVVKIEAHAVPPLTQAQVRMTALFGALHHEHAGFGQPPAAVLPDAEIPGLEHLDEGQYSDDTHAFSRYVDGGQE